MIYTYENELFTVMHIMHKIEYRDEQGVYGILM